MILKNNYKDIQEESLFIYNKKKKLNNMHNLITTNGFDNIDNQLNKWKVFVIKWYDKPLKMQLNIALKR